MNCQPGWRNCSYLAKYDLKTGLLQLTDSSVITMSGLLIFPMTAGIFDDDQSEPSDQASYYDSHYIADMQTLQAEPLIDKDGFTSGSFHLTERAGIGIRPALNQGGIGKCKGGQTSSMTTSRLLEYS